MPSLSQSVGSTVVIVVARSPFQVTPAAVKELQPYARTRQGVLVLIDCQLRK